MASYQSVLARATAAADKPYQAYTGEETAPINAQQQTGIAGINANAGAAQPYINAAGQMVTASGAPISAEDIARYQDPYTNSVINATQADFDVQNQRANSTVLGNAASAGALGGDRAGVAQALTQESQSRTQAPIIANLRSQGYQSALSAAENEKARLGTAGNSMASIGVAGQNAALTGANAQVGAGTLEQTTQQAADTAKMQDYFRQQGYDFQTAAYLAQVAGSMGSLMGGTSSTQGPTPNPWSQVAGVGVAALGAFSDKRLKEDIEKIGKLNDGQTIYRFRYKGDPQTHIGLLAQEVEKDHPEAVGSSQGYRTVDYKEATDDAVKRASGGSVMPWSGVEGWIPGSIPGLVHGHGAPDAPKAPDQGKTDQSGLNAAAKGAKSLWGKMNSPGDPTSLAAPGLDNYSSDSSSLGLAGDPSNPSGLYAGGGGVHGYDDGGDVDGSPVIAGFGLGSVIPHDNWGDWEAPASSFDSRFGKWDGKEDFGSRFDASFPRERSAAPVKGPIRDDLPPAITHGVSRPAPEPEEDAGVSAYAPHPEALRRPS
ncbi:MAG: tail fiber domain-containing protein, partial [Terracidiphilus sp.]